MKIANQNKLRADFLEMFTQFLRERGEDVGQIGSNAINFPVVTEDGEEGWIEVVVKIPKGTKDESADELGYGKREAYKLHVAEATEKARIASEKKAAKIAADQARRAAKAQKESESGE